MLVGVLVGLGPPEPAARVEVGDEVGVGVLDEAPRVGADALVLLSDVESLYTRPPSDPAAEPLDVVAAGADLSGLEFGATVVNGVGTGGAATKVSAARLAAASGIGVLVTSADLVAEALSGAEIGTWFEPAV